jgi:hypothetical protein
MNTSEHLSKYVVGLLLNFASSVVLVVLSFLPFVMHHLYEPLPSPVYIPFSILLA